MVDELLGDFLVWLAQFAGVSVLLLVAARMVTLWTRRRSESRRRTREEPAVAGMHAGPDDR